MTLVITVARFDVQHRNAVIVHHFFIDADMIFEAGDALAENGSGDARPGVAVQLGLEFFAIKREIIRAGVAAAAEAYAITFDELVVFVLFEVAEARNKRGPTHEAGRRFVVAGFGDGGYY